LNAANYGVEIRGLRKEFKSVFQGFKKHKMPLCIFPAPFKVDVETVPKRFQMKLLDL
jgi:hypothetical protein